jgi:thiol-disulfide isomerase/thioredoxin
MSERYNRRGFVGAALGVAALQGGMFAQGDGTAPAALPSLGGAVGWLNSEPLTTASLRGKVVVVNFWTYTCINWLRSLPYVRAWAEKYKNDGLVVIGVHSPEFGFEKDVEHVRRAVDEMRIAYPVAIDSGHKIWRAFRNQYWPATYIADRTGRIRHHRFGEGEYAESERAIQRLLMVRRDLASVGGEGVEAAADWASLRSPENYLGVSRTQNFASPGGATSGKRRVYMTRAKLAVNQWALAGDWTMQQDAIVLNEAGGKIVYRFHARDLHLVAAPVASGSPVRFRVRIDGERPGVAHGIDVDVNGDSTMRAPRLYQLIRQTGTIDDRLFEIEFLERGVEAYAFTFG